MAALGSDVQSTSIELVSVIESMREQRAELVRQMQKEEEERRRTEKELRALEAHLAAINASLAQKEARRQQLDRAIDETYTSFKSILDASKRLLCSAKDESMRIQQQQPCADA